MRVALLSMGSRGDAQPFIVLADELVRRGHEVVLGLSPNLVQLAESAGFTAESVGPDMLAYFESEQGRRLLASGNVRQIVNRLSQFHNENAVSVDARIRELCAGADVIVTNMLCEDSGSCVAEKSRTPFAALHCFPWRRTRGFAAPGVTTLKLPAAMNVATWSLVERMWWHGRRSTTNQLRKELGLAPTTLPTPRRMQSSGALAIQAYHPALVPEVTDYDATTPIVGYLTPTPYLRAKLGDVGVDGLLESWLQAAEPPVYFGFGSMPVTNPPATLAMIRDVADKLRFRAIISAGWSRIDVDTSDERIRVIGAVDHAALLPRCRAAVHHGGAGTTAAALLAGVPALVCSVVGDQPFWGTRLRQMGVGNHLRFRDLSVRTLTERLSGILDPALAARAQLFADGLRADTEAAARTADRLEKHCATRRAATI